MRKKVLQVSSDYTTEREENGFDYRLMSVIDFSPTNRHRALYDVGPECDAS